MFQFSAHSPVRKVHPGDGRFINCGNFQVLWNTNSNYWTKKKSEKQLATATRTVFKSSFLSLNKVLQKYLEMILLTK